MRVHRAPRALLFAALLALVALAVPPPPAHANELFPYAHAVWTTKAQAPTGHLYEVAVHMSAAMTDGLEAGQAAMTCAGAVVPSSFPPRESTETELSCRIVEVATGAVVEDITNRLPGLGFGQATFAVVNGAKDYRGCVRVRYFPGPHVAATPWLCEDLK